MLNRTRQVQFFIYASKTVVFCGRCVRIDYLDWFITPYATRLVDPLIGFPIVNSVYIYLYLYGTNSMYKKLKSHHHFTWKLPAAGNVGSGGVASGSDGNEKIEKPLRKVSCSERQLPHCSLKDSHLKFM